MAVTGFIRAAFNEGIIETTVQQSVMTAMLPRMRAGSSANFKVLDMVKN